jgi:hypothetical protein
MNPQPPTPPPGGKTEPDKKTQQDHDQLDQELDQELDDTFPASDPLPWSHEVK